MLSARLCRELATYRGVLNSTRELLASSRGLSTSCKRMRLSRSEVKAAKFLLQRFVFKHKECMYVSASFIRSKIQSTDQLLRLSGLLQIHTSSVREKGEKQEQDDDREKEEEDDDERDRMLSALKTAVGFLAVPLLIMLIYGGFGSGGSSGGGGGGGGGEDHSTSALSR